MRTDSKPSISALAGRPAPREISTVWKAYAIRTEGRRILIFAVPKEAFLKEEVPREEAGEESIVNASLAVTLLGRIIASCLFAFALAFGQSPSDGSSRPNLSGTWKLNVQRSGPILPRGTEALTVVIDHRESTIRMSETRTVSGKVTKGDGAAEPIDGQEYVSRPKPGKTVKQRKGWSGNALLMYWEMTEHETTYISDIRMTLSEDGEVLVMAEHYREPRMERVRDWVFEKQ